MRTLAATLLLTLACTCAIAQGPKTGFPPYGSFQNGSFDSTNLQNLNTFFQIPIVSSPGRGVNFSFAITYNTAMWSNTGYLGAWTPVTNINGASWGWNLMPSLGFFPFYANDTGCWYDHETEWGSYTTYSEFAYRDPQGTNHTFNGINYTVVGDGGSNCHVTTGGTEKAYADDSSGIYMDATQSILYAFDPTVMTTDGTQNNGLQLKDTNGNYYSSHFVSMSETDWIDSVGRVALKVITSSSSIQYEYYDPTGAYQTTTVNLTSIPVKTNFACFGITEYSGNVSLPTSIVLPNGQSYSMTYEPTPGYSGYYTGRLLKITLPTSGYYEYDYPTTGNLGLSCTDASITSLTRKVNATTPNWTYARTGISGAAGTTTVTAPVMPWDSAANTYVYTFNSNGQQTQELDYQGASTLLKTVNTTYATNGSPATRVMIIPATTGTIQSEVDTAYDSFMNLTQMTEYDWGSSAHGAAIRTTANTYLSSSPYTALNVMNRLSQKKVTIGGPTGTVAYLQAIGYDGTTLTACPTGVAGHDDTNYGCSFNTRGNSTSVTTYTNPAGPSGGITKYFTYDFFGNLLTAQVNCCQLNTYNYSTATKYSAPDSIVSGSSTPQLTVSATYNAYTGQTATSTDANGQITSYNYDILRRPTKVTRPDGTALTTCYSDLSTSPCYSTSSLFTISTTPISSSQSIQEVTSLDNLGRPSTVTVKDASNNVYSIVQTQYDPMGRAWEISNPYTSSPSYWTQTNFDALGRTAKTILPDTSSSAISYTGYSSGSSYFYCATATDQVSKSRESCSDGSGHTTMVIEDPGGTGHFAYQTAYAYNILDQLTQVTQGSQTRTYTYDGMGRVNSATTPEGGMICYGTISGGVCQNNGYDSWNNLTTRTDARGVITSYTYDSLNRPYQVTFNVGSTGVSSPGTVTYTFGTSSASNNNGRLISMSDGSGSEAYTYDNLGRTTEVAKVISSTSYPIYYSYNLGSELTQVTYPSGRVVTQSIDPIGRPCAIGASGSTCSSGTTYASGFSYNAAQELTGFNYGNGVASTFAYSPDRLQLTSIGYAKSGTTLFGQSYSYGSSNNGQIAGITDAVDAGRTASYSYDSLERLASASTSGDSSYPQWGLSMTYDRYGNRTGQTVTAGTAPANSLTVLPASNHISGTGFNYDANGNMTGDGVNTLTYDAENRTVSASGTYGSGSYVYDANGLRVKKSAGGTSTVYVFAGAQVIAEYDNGAAVSSPSREYIYMGHKLISTITSAATNYHLNDHQSIRVTTNSSGSVVGQQGHYPFGEQWYASSTTSKWFFSSYERDSESGNDYARARYYINRLARFSSLDPIAGSAIDPQSLNRYSYVLNDPINLVDHMGTCADDSPDSANRFRHSRERIASGDGPEEGEELLSQDDDDDFAPCDNVSGSDDEGGGGDGGYGNLDPSVPPPPPPDDTPTYYIRVYTYEPYETFTGIFCVSSCGPSGPSTDDPGLITAHFPDMSTLQGPGGSAAGGGGGAQSQSTQNKHCLAAAVTSGLAHGALDAVSLIPGAGTTAQLVSTGLGVADAIALGDAKDIAMTAAGLLTEVAKKPANALLVASYSARVAEAIPGVGTVVALGALALDGYQAYKKYQACSAGGN